MSTLEELQAIEIDTLRERIRLLEEMLVPAGWQAPVEWRLTPSENRVFAYLLTRDMCTRQQVMNALYEPSADEQPDMKIVDVFVCKMRAKLAPYGVEIRTHWGVGYSVPGRKALLEREVA